MSHALIWHLYLAIQNTYIDPSTISPIPQLSHSWTEGFTLLNINQSGPTKIPFANFTYEHPFSRVGRNNKFWMETS